jgi:hypothetical protein
MTKKLKTQHTHQKILLLYFNSYFKFFLFFVVLAFARECTLPAIFASVYFSDRELLLP